MLANGENSFNCSEESCNNPFADNYISFPDIYNLCSEEAENMEGRDKNGRFIKGTVPSTLIKKGEHISPKTEFKKGFIPWNKGKTGIFSKEVLQKIRDARKRQKGWNKGLHWSKTVRQKISIGKKGQRVSPETEFKQGQIPWNRGMTGEKNHIWKGGKKLAIARNNYKRNQKGFILLTNNNPYTESIEYHHIHPDLPYVVPCPTRIHKMFLGKTHYQNVNAMLGLGFSEVEL